MLCSESTIPFSRRQFLLCSGGGFGAVALTYLLAQESPAGEAGRGLYDVAAKAPHFAGTAKNVIFLFMDGGPSHIDLFDPKPEVNRLAGQKLPDSIKIALTASGTAGNPLLHSPRTFTRHGESGLAISEWLPHTARCADDLCVLRSCWADGLTHDLAISQMNTGAIVPGRPSLGSWVVFGLGTENQDLPAFVVLMDGREPDNGARNWSTAFLPATYQGTRFRGGESPITNLHPPGTVNRAQQRGKLDLLGRLNRRHLRDAPQESELEARIAKYELAFRMQMTAPEAIDIAAESPETLELYGLNEKHTEPHGRNCLLARRLVERGVRFVQVYCGSKRQWDSHDNHEERHAKLCRATDKPVAALLTDLKRRGLLNETLVVWGGEFGRTPMSQTGDGRDHNPTGFTMWFAGGGVRGGQVIGATDDFGLHAVQDRIHVHDLHATILHLMGLRHLELTFLHNGRDERATINGGNVVHQVLG